ncbi:tetratricopeptide repeat protein [Caballeronia ptereochthonis]|uniref:protein O-GlcNAc transferase n=1 Tax=Caballeronia ptereochthonis TaxID=1777144 RepID=A0A158EBV5_9BURK|nr:tetratricopeptide repeat protein [Caballeronia ptereochthonis]SAL03387.1 TPR repeat-containing protein [Caballeronia ptereochthonis]
MQATGQASIESFESTLASFRAGNRAQAAARCTEILSAAPAHPGANHLLGAIHLLGGDPATAESLIRTSLSESTSAEGEADLGLALKAQKRYAEAESALGRALSLNPKLSSAQHNLARLFDEQGNVAEAETAYRRAIELDPDAADFRFNFGKLLARMGRPNEALVELRRAVELRPASAEAQNSLGTVLAELGMLAEAEPAFCRALEIKPDFAEALCNLGTLLVELKRFPEAESALRAALASNPQFAGASEMLAKLLSDQGRRQDAIELFRHAVAQSPNDAGSLNALGALLAEERRFAEAEPILRRAVELSPGSIAALVNLGALLWESGQSSESEAVFRSVLEADPNHWHAAFNLGLLLKDTRRLDEAEVFHRRVVELKPRTAAAHVGLANVLLAKASGDVSEALDCFRVAIELDPDCQIAHSNLVYMLTFASDDGFEVLDEGRRFASHFEAPYVSRSIEYRNDLTASRRLRIGYVSPDFRYHCQAMFMLPLLRNHDHEAVEVYCYSSVDKPDHVTQEIAQLADVWRDVHELTDEQLAHQIKEDRIDVLVDLTMHMSRGRPLLHARRPAPVQVSWLAYPGTTGSTAIGYRLTDPWLDPAGSPEADARYSEKSIRLRDTFWCYDPMTTEVEVNPLPAYAARCVTFGCLNNPSKLTDRTFELWAQVLRSVEGSRLVLLLAQGKARETVSAKFDSLGICPSRLEYTDYRPRDQYLRAYHHIDIVLDTFPYNGHTTSLDALWMGVPVVTIVGNSPQSRAGYSLLSNLGLGELAASSGARFVDTAVSLATDLPHLGELRAGLRNRMVNSPLMNGKRFARSMEQAFRKIWHDECRILEKKG